MSMPSWVRLFFLFTTMKAEKDGVLTLANTCYQGGTVQQSYRLVQEEMTNMTLINPTGNCRPLAKPGSSEGSTL